MSQPEFSLLILAGGQSSRMGRDKAAIPFPGPQDPPIIHQIHRRLGEGARECLVAAPETYGLPARRVADHPAFAGPLAGLLGGLAACRTELALVVAADLPCPEPQLAAHLLELAAADPAADVVVPVASRGPEAMFAVYRTRALAQLEGAGRRGSARGPSMREALALVRVHEVPEPEWRRLDPVGASFTDCDTPRELAVAVGLAAGRREE